MLNYFGLSDSSLLGDLRRLEQEFDDLLGRSAGGALGIRSRPPGTFPAINVGSTDDRVTVYVFAPGVDPKSLDIQVQQNVLSIAGERSVPVEDKARYYRQERFSGQFNRVLTLPDDIDPEKVEAKYREGIVEISVKRRESARPRQIEVH